MCTTGSTPEQVDQYAKLLTRVAESDMAGSLQSMAGEVVHLPRAGNTVSELVGDDKAVAPTHVIMSRFSSLEEADAYRALPPSVALREGDARSPARAVLELVFEIEPVQGSETSSATL